MSLSLFIAHSLIHNKLQALELTHLLARIHHRNLIIYSVENGQEIYRAVFTSFLDNEFILSVANHRGVWQPTPFIGPVRELMTILTDKLVFTLSRWH
jgi:hypothetical protein